MPQAYSERRERLRAVVAGSGAEAALVTRTVNVRYLTGFTGSAAALLLHADGRVVLGTDGRYATQAREQAPDLELLLERATAPALARRAGEAGVRQLAFEAHDVTVEAHGMLAEAAGPAGLVPLGRAVEELRTVKDGDELALLRAACAISDRALAGLVAGPVLGRTEREVARRLESLMVDHGADGPAFETIVAAGPHSAVPHHRPTDRRIAEGDLLKVDFGARLGGYHADTTRTFVVAAAPAAWQADLHALVLAAQRAGREALAPGADARDVDGAARGVIAAAGHGEDYPHGLGHGVGLEVHEAPLLGYGSEARLRDGSPLTVEPGVYLPGRGGVRIEDILVVRDAAGGGPEPFTTSTHELLVLD